jgi:putative chitinase
MQFDHETLLSDYPGRFGTKMNVAASAGLRFLLGQIAADADFTMLRQIAYVLATINHETAHSFVPVRERMAVLGRSPAQDKLYKRQQQYKPYYGRGYVQITWHDNYVVAGRKLAGMTSNGGTASGSTIQPDSLVQNPELALDPAVSYAVASRGMREGWFTKKRLDNYIKEGAAPNYVAARAIINPGDCAELIGGYADKFELLLRAALIS